MNRYSSLLSSFLVKLLLLVGMLSCALAAAQDVAPPDLKVALSQYHSGDFQSAFRTFKEHANRNNVYALGNVGYMYLKGRGTTRDYKEAAAYFHKAAERGLAYAQHSLSIMYAEGLGVQQDLEESRK